MNRIRKTSFFAGAIALAAISIWFLPVEKAIRMGVTTNLEKSFTALQQQKIRELGLDTIRINYSELITDTGGNTLQFGDITGDKTIFFRFSELSCQPCVIDQAQFINAVQGSGLYRVVVLTDKATTRDLQILINKYKFETGIFGLAEPFNWGRRGVSYYFTIDENSSSMDNIFVVLPDMPGASINYFRNIFPDTEKLF
jgi:hypothetical protein